MSSVLLFALSACAPGPAATAARTPAPVEPLQVIIHPPTSSDIASRTISFSLNRPAYVSFFEVVPQEGVRMLAPVPGASLREFTAGANWSLATSPAASDYLPVFYQPGAAPPPRFIFAVASTEPMTVERFQRLGALRRFFGPFEFASSLPFHTMDVLASSVIPENVGARDWATDVYLDWGPAGVPATPNLQWRLMRCLNGRVLIVPAAYAVASCPGDQARAQMFASAPHTFIPVPAAPRTPERPGASLDRGASSRQAASVAASRERSGGPRRSGATRVDPGPRPVTPAASAGAQNAPSYTPAAPRSADAAGAAHPQPPTR